jgi:hypothetical protein
MALCAWLGSSSVYHDAASNICSFSNNDYDLPLHIGLTESFYRQQNFPPQDIDYGGVRLAYHFLVDFGTAQWRWLGLELVPALQFDNIWGLWLTVAAMAWWTRQWTADGRAASLAPWLLLLGGGTSIVLLWDESGGQWSRLVRLLGHLRHGYTLWDDWRWPNAIALILTQRPWLLALPLLLWIVGTWWIALRAEPDRQTRIAVAAGLLTGGLPLAHVYCSLILLAAAAMLAWLLPCRRLWRVYLGTAVLAVILPLGWLLWNPNLHPRHLGWAPGWDARGEDPITFWWHNLGLMPICMLFALRRLPSLGRFILPFALLFLAGNLFQVAPWMWDNIKLLFPCFAVAVPLVAMATAALSRQARYGPAAAALLGLLLIMSGSVECWRVGSRETQDCLYRKQDVEAAEAMSAVLPPRSVVVHRPDVHSVMYLCGTLGIVGLRNVLENRGLDPEPRTADVGRIYEGDVARAQKYGAGWILEYPPYRVVLPGCQAVVTTSDLRLLKIVR